MAEHQESCHARADELLEDFDDIVEELCFLSVKKAELIERIDHLAEGGENT